MSLQVWLPLNGDLENKGLASVTVTNNGATVDSGGKIGQCYSFNGSNSKIVNTLSSAVTSSVGTLCCWVKMNSLPGSSSFYNLIQLGSLGGYATCRLGIYIEYSNYINISIDGGGTGSNRYTHSLVADKWYHICATNNGTTVKLYIDGDEVLSKSSNKSSYTTAAPYLYVGGTSSYFLNGYMNDVRYYDNALSEKEIKEIAKGLVLHLPLNNNGLGNENILFNSKESFNVVPAANVNVTARSLIEDNTCPIGGKVASFTIGANGTTSSGCYYGMTQMGINPASSYLTSNATYTLSFYGKSSVTAYLRAAALVESQTLIKYTPTSDKGAFIKLTSNWQKYTVTFQWTSTSKMTVCFYADTNASEVTFNIAGLKLEEGSIATPWSPNPADEDYPASGSGIPENLFIATDMSESITTGGSTDWTKHFRMYNGSASIHTIDTTEMTDTVALTAANSNLGIAFVRLNSEINLDPTQYYTISCEAKCTNADLKLCIGLSYYNDQSTWVWRGGSNAKSFTTADTWQKITHTFKPDANTYAICYCFTINPGASPTGTDTFSIRKCKLEKGSTATEWQPSPIDDSYKTLGYYNNISFDQSGYNHNAVKYGNLIYSSDAPKYNVSTEFNGSQRIEAPFNPGNSPTFTVAGWFYHTSGTTYYGAKNTYKTFICLEGSRYFVYNSAGSAYVGNWTSTTNTWQHVVLVHDAITLKLKLYINGSFVSEVTTNGTIYGSDILDIGGRIGAAQYSGKMSDFRIYATALSAEDIKSLYNNNAYIDSNGKIYGKIR